MHLSRQQETRDYRHRHHNLWQGKIGQHCNTYSRDRGRPLEDKTTRRHNKEKRKRRGYYRIHRKMKIINFTLWLFVFTFSLFASQFALANTVSGTIRYENKTYDSSSGFTGTNWQFVRFANVEVVVGGSTT